MDSVTGKELLNSLELSHFPLVGTCISLFVFLTGDSKLLFSLANLLACGEEDSSHFTTDFNGIYLDKKDCRSGPFRNRLRAWGKCTTLLKHFNKSESFPTDSSAMIVVSDCMTFVPL